MGRNTQKVVGGVVAVAAVLLGIAAEVHHKRSRDDRDMNRWVRAEAMPYGGVMVEPIWTLELATTLDTPATLARTLEEVRRIHGTATVETLRSRFVLVEDHDGAHFDAPLMTAPEDTEAVRALARFAAVAHRTITGPGRGPEDGTGRGLASVIAE